MDRSENLRYILRTLLDERAEYAGVQIPDSPTEQQRLMRALLNVRPPDPVSREFLEAQDAELRMQLVEKGTVSLQQIEPCTSDGRLRIWQGTSPACKPTGQAKITDGYNLPARHVLHTVGPIVSGGIPSEYQEEQLADCYRSCLAMADAHGLESIAFCCISTGEFGFPQRRAAGIAVSTVGHISTQMPGLV